MLHILTSLLKSIGGQSSGTGGGRYLWALVLQADSGNALLETAGQKFSAKPEVPVKPGERLLLERLPDKDGTVQYKLIRRLPPSEGGTQPADSYVINLSTAGQGDTAYLLTAVKDEEERAATQKELQRWRFTLYTETLGEVTLVVTEDNTRISCSILVESEAAAARLAAGNLPQPPVVEILVRKVAVRQREWETGGIINRLS